MNFWHDKFRIVILDETFFDYENEWNFDLNNFELLSRMTVSDYKDDLKI